MMMTTIVHRRCVLLLLIYFLLLLLFEASWAFIYVPDLVGVKESDCLRKYLQKMLDTLNSLVMENNCLCTSEK